MSTPTLAELRARFVEANKAGHDAWDRYVRCRTYAFALEAQVRAWAERLERAVTHPNEEWLGHLAAEMRAALKGGG